MIIIVVIIIIIVMWAPQKAHICPCGGLVTADGSHGLSCGLGPGRYARHAYLNDIISRSLTLAGVPNIKEPTGISRTDGKCPDGLTLIPCQGGWCLLWDATVTATVGCGTLLPAPNVLRGRCSGWTCSQQKDREVQSADNILPLRASCFWDSGPH